jgi:hypothetical protein
MGNNVGRLLTITTNVPDIGIHRCMDLALYLPILKTALIQNIEIKNKEKELSNK